MSELEDIKRRAGIAEGEQQVQQAIIPSYSAMSKAGQQFRGVIQQMREAGEQTQLLEEAWAKISEGLEDIRRGYRL